MAVGAALEQCLQPEHPLAAAHCLPLALGFNLYAQVKHSSLDPSTLVLGGCFQHPSLPAGWNISSHLAWKLPLAFASDLITPKFK